MLKLEQDGCFISSDRTGAGTILESEIEQQVQKKPSLMLESLVNDLRGSHYSQGCVCGVLQIPGKTLTVCKVLGAEGGGQLGVPAGKAGEGGPAVLKLFHVE